MAAAEPSEEQLAAYLASTPERFRTEDRLTFRHVFLSATRRGEALEGDAKEIAATLVDATTPLDAAALGDPFLLGETFRQMPHSDVARTFGEGFARQLAAVERRPVAGTDPIEFRSAFRLRRGTSQGKPAAARRRPRRSPARVAECAADRGRGEALSHAARSLSDRGREARPRSQHRKRRDETPRDAPWRFRCAARGFRAGGRNPARLSGNAPDGARHLRPAVQDPGTRRRLAARDRPQAARGHERRDASAGAIHRRRLHRAPDDPAQRRARRTGRRDRGPGGDLDGRSRAARKPRRCDADGAAFADEDDVHRPERAGRLGSRRRPTSVSGSSTSCSGSITCCSFWRW